MRSVDEDTARLASASGDRRVHVGHDEDRSKHINETSKHQAGLYPTHLLSTLAQTLTPGTSLQSPTSLRNSRRTNPDSKAVRGASALSWRLSRPMLVSNRAPHSVTAAGVQDFVQ